LERVDEVVVRACTRFDDRHARSGVGHEDIAQAVTVTAAERPHRAGEVDDPPSRCVDIEHVSHHAVEPTRTQAVLMAGQALRSVPNCRPVASLPTMVSTATAM